MRDSSQWLKIWYDVILDQLSILHSLSGAPEEKNPSERFASPVLDFQDPVSPDFQDGALGSNLPTKSDKMTLRELYIHSFGLRSSGMRIGT